MRVTTRDPMPGNDIEDTRNAPFVVEGGGENALIIYFESEASLQGYREMAPRVPTPRSMALYG